MLQRSARCEERAGDGREEMGVFVGVEVGDVDAGALEFLYLGGGFAGDVFFADVAEEQGLEEVDERRAECFCRRGRSEWGWFPGADDGNAVGEDDVAAYAEGGVGAGYGDGVVEGWAGGHEGGGGEDAGLMELGDGSVDAGR